MKVIFLFIDGVGLGAETDTNPLSSSEWKSFSYMSGGQPMTQQAPAIQQSNHFFAGVDATLGVGGLPQSGTGQATLFTGENAAAVIGKHFGPFPHSGTKYLLRNQSLFNKVQALGKSATFINAYPDVFFQKARQRNRWSCTTLMTKSAGIRLHSTDEVLNEEALTAGLTQKAWRQKLGIDVPVITPEQAAHQLLSQAEKYEVLLHEYYLTDKAGHSQQMNQAHQILERYDRFFWALIEAKPDETTLVLCSDHGNIEDLSTKTHTFNKVPLFAWGPGAAAFNSAISIMDVTPGICDILAD